MKPFLICILLLHAIIANAQITGVAINDNNAVANASALLDVSRGSGTNYKGMLIPRLSTTERNAIGNPLPAPAQGLYIYNTTLNAFQVNISTTTTPNWQTLNMDAWKITGNIGTLGPTVGIGNTLNNNYIGTTDKTDFVFATNNLERMRISGTGYVGINNNAPVSAIHIMNNNLSDDFDDLRIETYSATATDAPTIYFNRARGSAATPAFMQAGDALIRIGAHTLTAAATYSNVIANLNAYAEANHTASSLSTYLTFSTTPSGSVSASERVRVIGSGNVGIGTTAPTATMHINGTERIQNTPAPSTTDIVGTLVADANGNVQKQSAATISAAKFGATLSVPNNTATILNTSGTKQYDNLTEVSSGGVFQPKASGLYYVSVKATFTQENTGDGYVAKLFIYLNGVNYAMTATKVAQYESGGSGSSYTFGVADILQLTTTDQVTGMVYTYGAVSTQSVPVTMSITRLD